MMSQGRSRRSSASSVIQSNGDCMGKRLGGFLCERIALAKWSGVTFHMVLSVPCC